MDTRTLSTGQGEVTVAWDEWGMPQISAANEPAGFHGLGYAHAVGGLNLVLHGYLRVSGRLAAAFGPQYVASDVQAHLWRDLEEARNAFERLPAGLRQNMEAFIEGIGAYMAEHPDEVPVWAPELEAALPVAVLSASCSWKSSIGQAVLAMRNSGVQGDPELFADPRHLGTYPSSNAMAIMPSRTASGATYLIADPHGDFAGMGDMLQFEIHAGDLVLGAVAPFGAALWRTGHTPEQAWAWTTGSPNTGDCYAVRTEPGAPRRFLLDGEAQEMEVRRVRIDVAGAEPVERELEYTRHNGVLCPVVGRSGDVAYAISSSYVGQLHQTFEQLDAYGRARSVEEVRDAMRRCAVQGENMTVADNAGHILYVRAGRVPVRPDGVDWTRPLDGNTAATAWLGIHPLEDLLQEHDPECGYVQACNSAPDTVAHGTGIDAGAQPGYLFNDYPGRAGLRGGLALRALAASDQLTAEDVIAIALDEQLSRAPAWMSALREAADALPDAVHERDPGYAVMLERLLAFDGRTGPQSDGALAYLHWREAVAEAPGVAADEPGSLANAVDGRDGLRLTPTPLIADAIDCDFLPLAAGEHPRALTAEEQERLLEAVETARARILSAHGTLDAVLGDELRVEYRDGSLPGRAIAPEVGAWFDQPQRQMWFKAPDADGRRWCEGGGWVCRVVELSGEGCRLWTALLPGTSAKPDSPHRNDQMRLFSEGRLREHRLSR